MNDLTFSNPVFTSYVIAATLMVLKAVSMSWLTVARMLEQNAGFRAPEDTKKTLINPKAHPGQTDRNEPVERLRRIHLNDLENLPFFVIAGLFYCLTAPSLLLAQCLFYGYVVTRLLHFVAYATARTHDLRALLWTPGSLIIVFMAGRTLVFAALGV